MRVAVHRARRAAGGRSRSELAAQEADLGETGAGSLCARRTLQWCRVIFTERQIRLTVANESRLVSTFKGREQSLGLAKER
jgi:hypothetical protein